MHVIRLFRRLCGFVPLVLLLCGARPAFAQAISSITNNTGGLSGQAWIGMAGDQVTIWGNTFSTVSQVTFGGIPAAAGTFGATSANTIVATIPSGAASGIVNVTFKTGTIIGSPNNFTVLPTGPYVLNFAPNTGNEGTQVILNGTRFSGVTAVQFRGLTNWITGNNLQVLSDTQINVNAPAGVNTGPLAVVAGSFTHVTASNFYVPPTITSFAPPVGRTGTNVVIRGQNLTNATAVQFGLLNAASFTTPSSTQIVAVVPGGAVNGPITVFTPAGSVMTPSNFVILPTITSFTPNAGAPGATVTITGANLNEGSGANGTPVVQFNGVASPTVSSVTFNQLTAVVPNGATTGFISVTTTNGTATSSTLFYFPPTVTGFTPNTNPPGTRIKITGHNFSGASAVTFSNNKTSPNFTVTNDTTIGAEVPAGLITGPISVTGPAGTGTSTVIYYGPPSISSFDPTHGLPGDIVRIYGTSFADVSDVRFTAPGGQVSAPILNHPSYITVAVPTNAITGPITVQAPGGTTTSAASFQLDYSTLQLTVTDTPDPVGLGGILTYGVQVQNLGPTQTSVTVSNILPASVTFLGSSMGGLNGGVFTANLGTLGVNATGSLTITVQPDASGITLTNRTTASGGLNPVPFSVITTTFVLPNLTIAPNPDGTFGLSWPLAASNYKLQFNPNLSASGVWSNLPAIPATNGNLLSVTVTNTGATMFYRLQP
jgi:hypothetical protein